jgi:N-alpha-acetyltransferase 15/16, NatA auxiliary subunit
MSTCDEVSTRTLDSNFEALPNSSHPDIYLLALRCLNTALAIDPEHPQVHRQAIELRHALARDHTSLPANVQQVIKSEFTAIAPETDLKKLNANFKAKHSQSSAHLLAALRVDHVLGADAAESEKAATDIIDARAISLEEALEVYGVLQRLRGANVAGFKAKARSKWPEATVFA